MVMETQTTSMSIKEFLGNVLFKNTNEGTTYISANEYLKEHKLGVFGLIAKNDKDGTPMILLAHRRDMDMWNIPGGGVDNPDASLRDELAREIFEETGYHVNIEGKPILSINPPIDPESTRYMSSNNGSTRYDAQVWMVASVTDGELSLNDEASGLQWCRLDRLTENTYVRHALFLESLQEEYVSKTFMEALKKSASANSNKLSNVDGIGEKIG